MKLVVIFLNKVEYLEDLLSAFLEIGISGATVLDSVGMGRIISYNIPIFAGLRDTFAGTSPSNKTILTVVDQQMVKKVEEVFIDICGNLKDPGTGFIFTVPVDQVLGKNHKKDKT